MSAASEWPQESVTDYRLRKMKEMDETIERLEWEAQRAINNLHNYRREVEAELLRMEGQYESR